MKISVERDEQGGMTVGLDGPAVQHFVRTFAPFGEAVLRQLLPAAAFPFEQLSTSGLRQVRRHVERMIRQRQVLRRRRRAAR